MISKELDWVPKYHTLEPTWLRSSIPTIVKQNFRLPGVDILREAALIYSLNINFFMYIINR